MIGITGDWGIKVFIAFSNSLKNLIGRGRIGFLIEATDYHCISKPIYFHVSRTKTMDNFIRRGVTVCLINL